MSSLMEPKVDYAIWSSAAVSLVLLLVFSGCRERSQTAVDNARISPKPQARGRSADHSRPQGFEPKTQHPVDGASPQSVEASLIPGRYSSANNLKRIGMAILNYQASHGASPPRVLYGPDQEPIHSWRVLILPFLESKVCDDLHASYRFDEPWHSPNNASLSNQIPLVYATRSKNLSKGVTEYVGCGDDFSALRPGQPDASSQLVVMECHSPSIPWLEPRDLTETTQFGNYEVLDEVNTSNIASTSHFTLLGDGTVRLFRFSSKPTPSAFKPLE